MVSEHHWTGKRAATICINSIQETPQVQEGPRSTHHDQLYIPSISKLFLSQVLQHAPQTGYKPPAPSPPPFSGEQYASLHSRLMTKSFFGKKFPYASFLLALKVCLTYLFKTLTLPFFTIKCISSLVFVLYHRIANIRCCLRFQNTATCTYEVTFRMVKDQKRIIQHRFFGLAQSC